MAIEFAAGSPSRNWGTIFYCVSYDALLNNVATLIGFESPIWCSTSDGNYDVVPSADGLLFVAAGGARLSLQEFGLKIFGQA
jgi:hypothetical protein